MKFLEEIAAYVAGLGVDAMPETTIVFPNRRAGLFFRKYLSRHIRQPVWSPAIEGISDFVTAHSALRVPDRITLVYELYKQFRESLKSQEPFDRFYYWGEIILRDFDELDRYLVDPVALYRNLAQIKDLEQQFEFLSEEQRRHIQSFWSSFGDADSDHKRQFLDIWQSLPLMYDRYRSALAAKGLAYEGLIYRQVSENMDTGSRRGHVIFAGFNALSESESRILGWYVRERSAKVFWDLDDYYFRDRKQEAGYFARSLLQSGGDLSGTFMDSYGNRFSENAAKKIVVIGTPADTGQAQVVSQLLESIGRDRPNSLEQDTAVVLPDEQLLLPVMHALPDMVPDVNITMGYPLRHALAYNFVELLVALQSGKKGIGRIFYYKPVLGLLRHPFLEGHGKKEAAEAVNLITGQNMIWIAADHLVSRNALMEKIFSNPGEGVGLVDYIRDLLLLLAPGIQSTMQGEMLAVCYRTLNNLRDFIGNYQLSLSGSGFIALFRQIMYSLRVPFEGEPLQGTQIMGYLETRNLDFKHVIVCSMNEEVVPPRRAQSSFIPLSLRRAFGLPTFEHHDALYAYLFYRQIQRAERVYLIYNSASGNGQSGEMSRYIRQLQMESGLEMDHQLFSSRVYAEQDRVVTIKKSPDSHARLLEYTDSHENAKRHLTPSALNTYLDCSLRFYFRYIARLYEEDTVQDDMDPLAFGKIFHDTMEQAYAPFTDAAGQRITRDTLKEVLVHMEASIETAFSRQFKHGTGSDFTFTGPNAVAREVVKRMATRVVEEDEAYAPFDIVGLEETFSSHIPVPAGANGVTVGVRLAGIIDRVDRKGHVLRVLDYKTGKDDKRIENITSLFDRDMPSRNKAAFQTFLYGLLVSKNSKGFEGALQAGLFNIRELFGGNFNYLFKMKTGRSTSEAITDLTPHLKEFEDNLKRLLSEIFSSEGAYSQTDDRRKCIYCPYRELCRR